MVAVRHALVDTFPAVHHGVLHSGRVHFVVLQCDYCSLVIANIHVDVRLGTSAVAEIFQELRMLKDYFGTSACFFGGDWNFVHDDDRRIVLEDSQLIRDSSGLSQHFRVHLGCMLELYQPNFTRAGVVDSRMSCLSRLDRIYTSFDASDLYDFIVMGDVQGDLFEVHRPSDHIPVHWTICSRPPRHPMLVLPIPRYIVEAPAFHQLVDPALTDCLPSTHIYDKLEFLSMLWFDLFPRFVAPCCRGPMLLPDCGCACVLSF